MQVTAIVWPPWRAQPIETKLPAHRQQDADANIVDGGPRAWAEMHPAAAQPEAPGEPPPSAGSECTA